MHNYSTTVSHSLMETGLQRTITNQVLFESLSVIVQQVGINHRELHGWI